MGGRPTAGASSSQSAGRPTGKRVAMTRPTVWCNIREALYGKMQRGKRAKARRVRMPSPECAATNRPRTHPRNGTGEGCSHPTRNGTTTAIGTGVAGEVRMRTRITGNAVLANGCWSGPLQAQACARCGNGAARRHKAPGRALQRLRRRRVETKNGLTPTARKWRLPSCECASRRAPSAGSPRRRAHSSSHSALNI
jgi:hypothetical protein